MRLLRQPPIPFRKKTESFLFNENFTRFFTQFRQNEIFKHWFHISRGGPAKFRNKFRLIPITFRPQFHFDWQNFCTFNNKCFGVYDFSHFTLHFGKFRGILGKFGLFKTKFKWVRVSEIFLVMSSSVGIRRRLKWLYPSVSKHPKCFLPDVVRHRRQIVLSFPNPNFV